MSVYVKTEMEAMPGSCAECEFGRRYGFVGDVYCRVLDDYFTGNVKPPHKERPDECPLHPDAQPNEPLTLEELRGMSGLPVWVESPGVDRDLSGRWVIVGGVNLDTGSLYTWGSDFSCHDYGVVWVAYRRPPKEDKK